MSEQSEHRRKILITDDSEINRMILIEMLEKDYEIIEAGDGEEALNILKTQGDSIDLLLLDCIMPKMDGFAVLAEMDRLWWKVDIPVIMISAENDQEFIVRAYKQGAVDYITRPFNSVIVRHKVDGIMRMHIQEKNMVELASSQIIEKHQNNNMMIHILSGIVEFRNGESGQHILNVQTLTEMFMRELLNITDEYRITEDDMNLIPKAAALHDIGKISVPSSILNKPGALSSSEFTVMKAHTTEGYTILRSIEAYKDDPLIMMASAVCRWHHERYDGRGYPDGIAGDDIPIAAQLVSLADVYDALTSERCYKKAYPHEMTVNMILRGECGNFNPILIECLKNLAKDIPDRLRDASSDRAYKETIQRIIENTLRPSKYSDV
ncbi:MAG TPA: two-component system response regulator [Lachnospiraceae bacterium]|nr:two-component system response regulator [Lachnospiraceae bacterium]